MLFRASCLLIRIKKALSHSHPTMIEKKMPARLDYFPSRHFPSTINKLMAYFLHSAFFDAYLSCDLLPRECAALLGAEGQVHQLHFNGHIVVQNAPYHLIVFLHLFHGEGDFEILVHGTVGRQTVVADDAALLVGATAHLIAAAELLRNRHVDL